MTTHRCKGSLENCASIRNYGESWIFSIREIDYNYCCTFLRRICVIDFCPFCGERLGK